MNFSFPCRTRFYSVDCFLTKLFKRVLQWLDESNDHGKIISACKRIFQEFEIFHKNIVTH